MEPNPDTSALAAFCAVEPICRTGPTQPALAVNEGPWSIVGFNHPSAAETGDHEIVASTALGADHVVGFKAVPFRRATAVGTTNVLNSRGDQLIHGGFLKEF